MSKECLNCNTTLNRARIEKAIDAPRYKLPSGLTSVDEIKSYMLKLSDLLEKDQNLSPEEIENIMKNSTLNLV